VRPILGSLAAELAAASGDGTWPGAPELDQVWVQPGGEVLLLDALRPGPNTVSEEPPGTGEQDQALGLLHRVAAMASQGKDFPGVPGPIRAPVPLHAAQILTRLGGGAARYGDVEQVRAAFEATQDLPVELDPATRVAYPIAFALLFFGKLLVSLGLVGLLWRYFPILFPVDPKRVMTLWVALGAAVLVLAIPALTWIVWALATRGGLGGPMMGVMLLGPDGRPPSRWRCAWREALAWIPLAGLIAAQNGMSALGWLSPPAFLVVVGAPAWVLMDAAHAWFFGGRLLRDRLARVYAVPR
jgi:hypothetical protein